MKNINLVKKVPDLFSCNISISCDLRNINDSKISVKFLVYDFIVFELVHRI